MTDDPKYKIVSVDLDERTVVRRNAEIEHERAVAIFDLLENNYFKPVSLPEGPYAIDLSVEENRLNLIVRNQDKSAELGKLVIQLRAFRRIIRDYFLICESYYTAIKDASLSQIEAIDMGRRGLHNEGADLLKETLATEVAVDGQTARRLFTLLCVLHIRG
tara:strand:- start:258 stop:740 length:483 start_codon:yes stop_codon:yes gene_type:complete